MRTPVLACLDGVVKHTASQDTGYGRYIILDHPGGWHTWYGHLETIDVRIGQIVERGQHIGTSGNSGNSEGPHLHLTVQNDQIGVDNVYWLNKIVDPLKYL